MNDFFNTTLNLIAQFTGGRGGIDYNIVQFELAAIFWVMLIILSVDRQRHGDFPHEELLLWGFSFALGREFLMLFMAILQAYGIVDPAHLHVVFPPMEHMLSNIAEVLIAGAFLRYLLKDLVISSRYIKAGIGLIALCYLATFWWWGGYIIANPDARFGQTWCGWVFRITASGLLLYPIILLYMKTGGLIRNIICTALSLFFLYEFMKIPDMALGEVYGNVFAPLRHGAYILAIPLFGYVYIKEISRERESLNKELKQVIYVASHDLRSPLVNIDGYSAMLGFSLEEINSVLEKEWLSSGAKQKLAPLMKEIRESMKYISSSVSKMSLLLNGLLRYSRSGRIDLKQEKLDMNELVSSVGSNLEFLLSEKEAKFRISELPPCLGDKGQISQVFSNLIGNALKYLDPERPGVIKVYGYYRNGRSVYCVEDNGIGISPEHSGKVFEIFHQLEPSADGEGLGLSIVDKIVERHNGKIWVESEQGRGSKFFISLLKA